MCRHRKIFTKVALFALLCLSITHIGAGRTLPYKQRPRNGRAADSLPVVYVQQVRRLPPEYPDDQYVEEVVEVFNFRHGSPSFTFTDEDIDRMIRCDFDPTLKECKLLRKPVTPPKRPATRSTTAATPYQVVRPTYRTTTTTTTIRPYVYERRPTAVTTTPIADTTTTTEYLPFLPDIPETTPLDYYEFKPRLPNSDAADYDDPNTDHDDNDNDMDNEVAGDIADEYADEDAGDEDVENYN